MTTAILSRKPFPLRFPTPIFLSYMYFALLIWAAVAVFVFTTTAIVSIWNDIDTSGWSLAGQAARWFVLGLMCHLGWTMFELYITHGRTRRTFFLEAIAVLVTVALASALIFTLTFVLEAGYYGLMGWEQGISNSNLYTRGLDLPMIGLDAAITFILWAAGGFFIATALYRNGILGAAAILFGVGCVIVSTMVLGEPDGPGRMVVDRVGTLSDTASLLMPDGSLNMAMISTVHIALAALLVGLSWLWLRDTPIKGKSEKL